MGRAGRAGRRRVLPRVRPGAVRHGPDDLRRRRTAAGTLLMRGTAALKLAGVLAGLLVLTGIVLYLVPSSDYILLPDTAHPVAPLVRVQGGHSPKGPGAIFFVDVFERRASMLESLFPSFRTGATLVPSSEIVPPG